MTEKIEKEKKRTLGLFWGIVLYIVLSVAVCLFSMVAGMIWWKAIAFSVVIGFVLVLMFEVGFASKDYNPNDNYNM
jgi:hypothetical protein